MSLQGLNRVDTMTVAIDGAILPSGFADGDAVRVEFNADIYTDAVGSDGDLHQAASADKTGRVTIRAKNTSLALRLLLDGILRRHEAGISTPHTIVVRMDSTGEVYTCTGCRPTTRPVGAFNTEVSDREYVFRAAQIIK